MKRFIGFISYRSFILSIIFAVFLIAFICLAIYSKYNYNEIYKQELDVNNGEYSYTLESVFFFGTIHFVFVVMMISFGMWIVFYFNKIFINTKIYELTGINSWITFCSIIPVVGIFIDWFIFYKSVDSFEERKMNDIILNYHFVKSINITQTIFCLLLFMILNSIIFIIYPGQIFGGDIWASYSPICLTIQSLASFSFFICLIIGIIYFIVDLTNLNELIYTLKINKKECLSYIFFPWLITNSKYENPSFFKVVKDF